MSAVEQEIQRHERKMQACNTMTELLVAMSSWQSYADSHGLSEEEREPVNQAYLAAESRLIGQVSTSLW